MIRPQRPPLATMLPTTQWTTMTRFSLRRSANGKSTSSDSFTSTAGCIGIHLSLFLAFPRHCRDLLEGLVFLSVRLKGRDRRPEGTPAGDSRDSTTCPGGRWSSKQPTRGTPVQASQLKCLLPVDVASGWTLCQYDLSTVLPYLP
jgi:hypothetical protein